MQAQSKVRTIAAPAPEALPTLIRTIVALVATATLLFLFSPSVIRAQDKPGTHTVVAGESLWTLATQFYGDGQKWTDLAKLNGLGDTGQKQLVVGQVIKVPAQRPAVASKTSATPPPNTPRNALQRALQPQKSVEAAAPAASTGALAAQTAGKRDAAAKAPAATTPAKVATAAPVRPKPEVKAPAAAAVAPTGTVEAPEARAASNAEPVAATATKIWNPDLATLRGARGTEQPTVFLGRTYDPAETAAAVAAVLPANKVRPRTGEFLSAPYVVAAPSFTSAGTVGRRTGAAAGSFRDIERLVLIDDAEVILPAGVSATVGARFVSVDAGPLLGTGAQVAVPTGVFEVVRAEAGRPVVARVVQQSGRIEEGQKLFALEGGALNNGVKARPIARAAGAPETEVVWVEGGALLPSLQSYLVLGAGERDGVKAGDEFALVKRMGLGADAQEQRIALVRVVRVTAFGSSAIVVKQDQPLIAVGGAARLVARVQ